jgi:hypothetical protein
MSEEEDDELRLANELRRLWDRGTPPSALVRTLRSRGMGGGQIITVMQRAFALTLSKTHAITGWLSHGDDERLDRFLIPHMPDRLEGSKDAPEQES